MAKIQLPTIATLVAYGAYLLSRDPRRRLGGIKHPVMSLAIAIMVLALLSVPGGVYPGLSFRFILKDYSKTFLLMIVIAASIRDRADLERLGIVNLVGAALYSVMVLVRIPIGEDGRLGDLYYYDANDLAMLLVMSIPFAVFFLRKRATIGRKLIAMAGAGIFLLALVKTGSRGGFLGLIATVLFLLFRYRAIPGRVRFGAVGVMVLLLTFVASDKYWSMMGTLLHPTNDYNWSGKAESGRMEIWKRGIGYMLENPFTGVGANAFPAAEGMISPLAARQEIGIGLKWSAAHNSFVEIGAELGVGGILLFLALLYRTGRTLGKIGAIRGGPLGVSSDEAAFAQAIAAALIGYCVAGFFLSQAYSAYLYCLLGMTVALARVTRRTQNGVSNGHPLPWPSRGSDGGPAGWTGRTDLR